MNFRMLLFFTLTLPLTVTNLIRIHAQEEDRSLHLMESAVAALAADESHDWTYDPGEAESTILIQTISGSLDPKLEVLNSDGETIAENNDWTAAFSTEAALLLEGGQPYTLRVSSVFGEGDYRIFAVPGDIRMQWIEDFMHPGDWTALPGVRSENEQLRLQTPRSETVVFMPPSAPLLHNVYLQAAFEWTQEQTESTRAGLLIRGRRENTGFTSAVHFAVTPDGEWVLERTDISGITSTVESGTLPAEGRLTLGLLAQGTTISYFANGILLGSAIVENNNAPLWGIEITSATVVVDDFWLATSPQEPPDFPEQLEEWNTTTSIDIASALIEAGLLPVESQRRLVFPAVTFTVAGAQQRTFQLGNAGDVYDSVVLGTEVRFTEAEDTACGISARHIDEDNQIIAFVDNQNGAGLLWWQDNVLLLNNYTLIDTSEDGAYHLLLILDGMYAAFYVNGQLTAQNLVPHLTGDFGVSFINYAASSTTCTFQNFWVWQ